MRKIEIDQIVVGRQLLSNIGPASRSIDDFRNISGTHCKVSALNPLLTSPSTINRR